MCEAVVEGCVGVDEGCVGVVVGCEVDLDCVVGFAGYRRPVLCILLLRGISSGIFSDVIVIGKIKVDCLDDEAVVLSRFTALKVLLNS